MTNNHFSVVNPEFTKLLEENLVTYTTFSSTTVENEANLFKATKEIAIARYALSSQALAYQASMEILLSQLDHVRQTGIQDKDLFRNIMTLLAGIEAKSQSLINSAKQVTDLLGRAVEIDVDKAALRSLLVATPALLEETITRASGDPELASRVSISFNARINELMIACRLNRSDACETLEPDSPSSGRGISLTDYSHLMNSVPSQPQMTQPTQSSLANSSDLTINVQPSNQRN